MAQPYHFQNYEGSEMEQLFNKINDLGPATTEDAGLMSAAEKLKLDGIAGHAQVNVLESIMVNGVPLSILSKAINILLDNMPTTGSSNFVSSGGVAAKLELYYTKNEVDSIVGALHQFSYVIAESLPAASASTMWKIYFIPSTNPKTENAKDEFITIRSGSEGAYTYSWEQIGSTAISGITNAEIDALFS